MRATFPNDTEPMLEFALWWSTRGWLVFPLCSPEMGEHSHRRDGPTCDDDVGKAPMIDTGFKGGTNDAKQIQQWWTRWPNANIGATPPSGHVVVDIDGDSELEWADTCVHHTAKGRHLIYRDPEGRVPHGNRVWPNVDTRVSGKGYIVLPPSLHKSFKRYALSETRKVVDFPYPLLAFKQVRDSPKRGGGRDSDLAALLAKDV